MEKLDRVIEALEYCLGSNEDCAKCYLNGYDGCRDQLNLDALNLLNALRYDNQRLREMWADAVLEKSRVDQERAFYMEIAHAYRESEPMVHAHWEVVRGVLTPGGDPLLRCPRCRSRESEHLGGIECNRPHWNYCPHCGAHMDEEVAG